MIFTLVIRLVILGFAVLATPLSQVFGAESDSSFESSSEDTVDFRESELYELMDSPAIRNLVSASTFAANRAVDNAMDALFYSLLDRTWPLSKTRFSVLETGIERKLTKLPTKSYLMIDRVMVGPSLTRDLLPPSPLGVSTRLSAGVYFYEFYVATDAERLAATKVSDLSTFSPANWFGILPLLTRILPPSFEPNELYNPLRTLAVPLKVPLTSSDLRDMPTNSIRSYAIKGTISFPLSHQWLLERLPKIGERTGLDGGLPVNFYGNAEARVSVQKRSENEYRVSLSNIRTEGLSLGFEIGKTFYAFGVSLGKFSWKGLPVPIIPLKAASDRQLFQEHTEMRDINLSHNISEEVLAQALTGNFIALDETCKRCLPTTTSKIGRSKSTSRGSSSFFFDTTRESVQAFANHTVQSKEVDLAYRESRHERKSANWNIMNGSITNEALFSWSTPLNRLDPQPLIWGKFSLIFPNIDERSLFEVRTRMQDVGFLPKMTGFDEMSKTISGNFREKQSLSSIKTAPPLEAFQNIFSGPKIVGDFEIVFDIYAEDSAILSIAKMPPQKVLDYLQRFSDSSSFSHLNPLCRASTFSALFPADDLDVCWPSSDSVDELGQLQTEILNAKTSDERKQAASSLIAHIGILGFMELVHKTQLSDRYSIYVKSVCRPRPGMTDILAKFCKGDQDGVLQKRGEMDAEKYAWWLAKDAPDPLSVTSNESSLKVLRIDIPKEAFLDSFVEVVLSEPIDSSMFLFLRIETKGKLNIVRTLVFEDILQLNTDLIDRSRIIIPRSFFSDDNAEIANMKLEELRITVNVSRDRKTWSAIKVLEK